MIVKVLFFKNLSVKFFGPYPIETLLICSGVCSHSVVRDGESKPADCGEGDCLSSGQ